MKVLLVLFFACLACSCARAGKTPSEVINTLLESDHTIFVKSGQLLKGLVKLPTFKRLRKEVVTEHLSYVIDFTDTKKNKIETAKVRKLILAKFAVYFKCDWLLANKYNGKLLFTPISDIDHPNVAPLLSSLEMKKMMKFAALPMTPSCVNKNENCAYWADVGYCTETYTEYMAKNCPLSCGVCKGMKGMKLPKTKDVDDQTVPNIAFYINLQYQIPASQHTFPKSLNGFVSGTTTFCVNPHISVIFQVNFQRSLAYGASGGATPDAKIVRISADDNTGGAGIHLNDKLTTTEYYAPWDTLDGYFRDWATSAIAKEYSVDINMYGNKASVLKTMPANNVNPETEFKEVSGFTLGVTGGGEVNEAGPKAKMEASASYTQSRWVTFSTADYELARSTSSAQNIKFTMKRGTYPVASSLLNRATDALWVNTFPADLGRVKPIAYQSYVPKFDVVYKASAAETGTTRFNVRVGVQIMPLYHAAYKHYYVVGGHQSYHGTGYDREGTKLVHSCSFDVDWDHAVFTGGRPVNLQTKAFADKCVHVDDAGNIYLRTGDIESAEQSFIYDNLQRYVSTKNLNLCLDGTNLKKMQPCTTTLNQRWKWVDNSNYMVNENTGKRLGVDRSTARLGLYDADTPIVNTEILTAFTDLFVKT